jgi:hypothetical protein
MICRKARLNSMKLFRRKQLPLVLAIGVLPWLVHDQVDAFSFNVGLNSRKETLNIAFVTGNEMKAREIEMILCQEGAIDLEHPENSLGESDNTFVAHANL